MASESEGDEFFDAEDVPVTGKNLEESLYSSITNEPNDSDLNEEEQLLHEQKKLLERRQKEDAELRQKLESLKIKKQQKSKEEERKAQESQLRRKRLEYKRQNLYDDSFATVDDSSFQDTFSDIQSISTDLSGTSYKDSSSEPSSPSSHYSEKESEADDQIFTKPIAGDDMLPPFKENSDKTELDDQTNKISHHVVPEISQRSPTPEKQMPNLILNGNNEPDIVKSSKPKVQPATLLPPVAPPRKRTKKLEQLETDSERSSVSEYIVGPANLIPLPTPASAVESVTQELEHSLDLQSAIGVSRHVNTQEAELEAVKHDVSREPSPNLSDSVNVSSENQKQANVKEKTTKPYTSAETVAIPRSASGRILTDEDILEAIFIKNLDTGEEVPLSHADDIAESAKHPLDDTMKQRTHDQKSSGEDVQDVESKDEDTQSLNEKTASGKSGARKKALKLRKFLGKKMNKTMTRVRQYADQVIYRDENVVEKEVSCDGENFKIKSSGHNKGPYDFTELKLLQELNGHSGAIWILKFSPCGKLLATGGQDGVSRVWALKNFQTYFEDLKQKFSDVSVSPAPSMESINSMSSETYQGAQSSPREVDNGPFARRPLCEFRGHSADVLDIAWSKNNFLLSSSMDKTVRLWHVSRKECLCTFQHIDFVTAIVFHPKDDRHFLSGSLDGKIRLWNIPDKKVTLWNEVSVPSTLITTANFCHNGKFAVVGTYDGRCIFYSTEQLKYFTQIHVRSTSGKNSKGKKITGIEPQPGEDKKNSMIHLTPVLVTSNDSRIRLYDLRDLTLTCKYKGLVNSSSQIKASFGPKSKYIICGSEDHFIYIWKTRHNSATSRRDRNDFWEAIKVHNAVVTVAVFAENLEHFSSSIDENLDGREVIVSADYNGAIKIVCNIPREDEESLDSEFFLQHRDVPS